MKTVRQAATLGALAAALALTACSPSTGGPEPSGPGQDPTQASSPEQGASVLFYQYGKAGDGGGMDYATLYDPETQETIKRVGLPATGSLGKRYSVSRDREWVIATETEGKEWFDSGMVAVFNLADAEDETMLNEPTLIDIERVTGKVGEAATPARVPIFDPLSDDLLLFLNEQESANGKDCKIDLWRMAPEGDEATKDGTEEYACGEWPVVGPEGDLVPRSETEDEEGAITDSGEFGFTDYPEALEQDGVPLDEVGGDKMNYVVRREADKVTWALNSTDAAHKLYRLSGQEWERLTDPGLVFEEDSQTLIYPPVSE